MNMPQDRHDPAELAAQRIYEEAEALWAELLKAPTVSRALQISAMTRALTDRLGDIEDMARTRAEQLIDTTR